MRAIDRLFLFLAFAGIWALAGMFYLQHFHEGGRARAAAPVTVTFPAKIAVENAPGTALRVANAESGPLKVATEAAPPPALTLKLDCRVVGKLETQKPGVTLFGSGRWEPQREWPLAATLECKTP